MGEMLTRAAILDADDLQVEEVPVPEWGGAVLVRGLTGAERDRFEASAAVARGGKRGLAGLERSLQNFRARVVAMATIGEDGKRLFTDADAKELGEKSAFALERVFDAIWRLSGLTEAEVSELAEDFGGAQSGGSGSI